MCPRLNQRTGSTKHPSGAFFFLWSKYNIQHRIMQRLLLPTGLRGTRWLLASSPRGVPTTYEDYEDEARRKAPEDSCFAARQQLLWPFHFLKQSCFISPTHLL